MYSQGEMYSDFGLEKTPLVPLKRSLTPLLFFRRTTLSMATLSETTPSPPSIPAGPTNVPPATALAPPSTITESVISDANFQRWFRLAKLTLLQQNNFDLFLSFCRSPYRIQLAKGVAINTRSEERNIWYIPQALLFL